MYMITGLTMIKAMPGHEQMVYDQLQGMDGIKDVYKLFGEFDFFVIMQADGSKRLSILADIVRHLSEVVRTSQLMIARDEARIGHDLDGHDSRETAFSIS